MTIDKLSLGQHKRLHNIPCQHATQKDYHLIILASVILSHHELSNKLRIDLKHPIPGPEALRPPSLGVELLKPLDQG